MRESVRNEIRRLQRELGATMIMVTHDQLDALASPTGSPCCAPASVAIGRSGRPLPKPGERLRRGLHRTVPHEPVALPLCRRRRGVLAGRRIFLSGPGQMRLPPKSRTGEVLVGFRPEAATVHRHPTSGAAMATISRFSSRETGRFACCASARGDSYLFDSRALVRVGEAVWLAWRPIDFESSTRQGSGFLGGRYWRETPPRWSNERFSKSWENDDLGGNDAPRTRF